MSNGDPVERVTPLVRAKGAELGVRTVAIPHLAEHDLAVDAAARFRTACTTATLGRRNLARPAGVTAWSLANYYSPRPWLIFDGDVSWSQARFDGFNEAGPYIPEAVDRVVSAGASVDNYRRVFGSLRLRYFGPRPLVADDSVRSKATTLVNVEGGYQVTKHLRVNLEVFNLVNARVSDIDYYFASRLPGEPLAGVTDIHTHPTVPRTARVNLIVRF